MMACYMWHIVDTYYSIITIVGLLHLDIKVAKLVTTAELKHFLEIILCEVFIFMETPFLEISSKFRRTHSELHNAMLC